MANPSLVVRLLSASVAVSHKAGRIIRDIMKTGELGIVDKVSPEDQPLHLTYNPFAFLVDFLLLLWGFEEAVASISVIQRWI